MFGLPANGTKSKAPPYPPHKLPLNYHIFKIRMDLNQTNFTPGCRCPGVSRNPKKALTLSPQNKGEDCFPLLSPNFGEPNFGPKNFFCCFASPTCNKKPQQPQNRLGINSAYTDSLSLFSNFQSKILASGRQRDNSFISVQQKLQEGRGIQSPPLLRSVKTLPMLQYKWICSKFLAFLTSSMIFVYFFPTSPEVFFLNSIFELQVGLHDLCSNSSSFRFHTGMHYEHPSQDEGSSELLTTHKSVMGEKSRE